MGWMDFCAGIKKSDEINGAGDFIKAQVTHSREDAPP
jgi:hypothetical protein